MRVYQFDSGGYNTSRNAPGGFLRIEIMIQDSKPSDWGSGLTEPDFSSTKIPGEYLFSFAEVSRRSPFEPGLIELQSLDLTVDNSPMVDEDVVASGAIVEGMIYKVIGYTTVRYFGVDYSTNDIFIGVPGVNTFTTVGSGTVNKALNMYNILKVVNKFDRTIHLRLYHKKTSGGSFVVRGHWIIDDDTVAITRPENDTKNDWIVEFTCVDSIRQFEQRTLINSVDDSLAHVDYDYLPGIVSLTFVGDNPNGVLNGRYGLDSFWRQNGGNGGGENYAISEVRVFKLVELFDAMSGYIGFAGSVNDGGSWVNFYSTRFYINNHSTPNRSSGGETLVPHAIDNLYIISAFWHNSAYDEYQTFFDRTKSAPHSLYGGNSYLDMLTDICTSLGAFYRVRINGSNERYLEIVEIGLRDTSTINITDLGDIFSPSTSEPNAINISGVEIAPPHGENVVRGAQDSNSKKSATFFSVASYNRADQRFVVRWLENSATGGFLNVRTTVRTDFLSSLWASADTPTGSRSSTPGTGLALNNILSVCGIAPRDNIAIPAADPGNIPEYGEWRPGIGVFYPTTASPFNSWSEVPSYALAHILYNDVDNATDPIGYWRSRGEAFELTIEGIGSVFYPPFVVTMVIDGVTQTIYVQEVIENYYDNFTTYSGYTK